MIPTRTRLSGANQTCGRGTRRWISERGLSLVEMTIILSVLAILSGVMAPAGVELVSQARDVRVLHDAHTIRQALFTLLTDLGLTTLRVGGASGTPVELLVTNAPTPEATGETDAGWIRELTASGTVDLLDRHLVSNDPAGNTAWAYQLPTMAGGLGWRGAYLRTSPGADPWGHRYAVNVQFLDARFDVLVLSAGPNGQIETPYKARNLAFGGDDVAVLVR